ncbi:MAG: hypothetical protein NTU73_11900 [Ignavibacteriae bacterium]|nr:hypothetical protein [Ignavibacteriota bacterium]
MLTKNKPLLFLIFGIEVMAGIILLVLGFFTDPAEMLDKEMPLQKFFFIIGAVLFVGPFIAGTLLYVIGSARKRLADKLKKTGLHGSVNVVSVSPSSGKLNNLRRVDIIMDVNVPGKIPYRIEHGEYFDIKNIDKVKPGMTLNVLVDPDNQNKMVIVW